MRLEGKVALITGAARGQGAAEARMFAQEGAKVILADVTDQEGIAVAAEIAEAGGDAIYVHLDVTNEDEWDSAVQSAVASFGKLDILVNNAGIWRRGHVMETSSEQWDDIIDVNAKGVFLGTKAAIPEMRKAGGGSIVNISSIMGVVGASHAPAYSAAKGAIRLFTKAAAIQYAGEKIRVNSVHPGFVVTPLTQAFFSDPEESASRLATVPAGRFGTADEIASGILFLASDESSYMTGSELVIDGGMTAR